MQATWHFFYLFHYGLQISSASFLSGCVYWFWALALNQKIKILWYSENNTLLQATLIRFNGDTYNKVLLRLTSDKQHSKQM